MRAGDSSARISVLLNPTSAMPHDRILRPGLGASPTALFGWAVVCALAFTAMRAVAMLGPVQIRPLFLLHCVIMAATPWLLLTAEGRVQAGLRWPVAWRWVALAPVVGIAASTLCFVLGATLYGQSGDNWFVSVANSFRAQRMPNATLRQLHLLFTIPGMLFSPIGEEIFFRGVLQRAFETRLSSSASALLESAWFGAAHLIHHGIVLTAAGVSFRTGSGALWFALMTALSLAFATLRKRSGSVLPAIVAHSAFNGTMNAYIFAFLWH